MLNCWIRRTLAPVLIIGACVACSGLIDEKIHEPDLIRNVEAAPGFAPLKVGSTTGLRSTGPVTRAHTILYFHGSASTARHDSRILTGLSGYDVFVAEYSGFDGQEGRASEAVLKRSAADWMKTVQAAGRPVIVIGYSLGGALALEQAANGNAAALLTMNTFDWIGSLVPKAVKSQFGQHYDARADAGRVTAPWLIWHCAHDPHIPVANADRLLALAPAGRARLYKTTDCAGHAITKNNIRTAVAAVERHLADLQ